MINIKEPYYTAGKKFHWPQTPIGLGIKLSLLDGSDELELTVGDSPKVYVINKRLARDFVKQYRSYFDANRTKLGVLPWALFKVKEENYISQLKLI